MMKGSTSTYYIFGYLNYNGYSADRFETPEEAESACIESMKKRKAEGWEVSDQCIVRVERLRISDEFMVIKEQETKTTVLVINKNCAEESTEK